MPTSRLSVLSEKALNTLQKILLNESDCSEFISAASSPPFYLTNNGVVRICQKKQQYWIEAVCSWLKIKAVIIDDDTQKQNIHLLGMNLGEQTTSFTLQMSSIFHNSLDSLLDHGTLVYDDVYLREYLTICAKKAPVEHTRSTPGWKNANGIPCFQLAELILPENSKMPSSAYQGHLDLIPVGSLEVWLNAVTSEVVPKIPLYTSLLLGFASPLLAFLKETFSLDCPIFCLANDSSKGKTTAAMLLISIFSNPLLKKGTMTSLFGTQNALISFLPCATGLPVVFDETGLSGTDGKDTYNLLYRLASGVSKSRLSKAAELKDIKTWASFIMLTSENPILQQDAPKGLRARCFEIKDTLTASASQAEQLKRVATENYGNAGVRYMQWLVQRTDKIAEDFQSAKATLLQLAEEKRLVEKSLSQRILTLFSLLTLASSYFSECFHIPVPQQELTDYLIQKCAEICCISDNTDETFDQVLQSVYRYISSYTSEEHPNSNKIIGKLEKHKNEMHIFITTSEFQNICKEYHIQKLSFLKDCKKKGLLLCEDDRLSKRVTLVPRGIPVACYTFKIASQNCPPAPTVKEINALNFPSNKQTVTDSDLDF